jgi:hypothetical protein
LAGILGVALVRRPFLLEFNTGKIGRHLMAQDRWYFKWDDDERGPFSALELQNLMDYGLIDPETLFRNDNRAKWEEAEEAGLWATLRKEGGKCKSRPKRQPTLFDAAEDESPADGQQTQFNMLEESNPVDLQGTFFDVWENESPSNGQPTLLDMAEDESSIANSMREEPTTNHRNEGPSVVLDLCYLGLLLVLAYILYQAWISRSPLYAVSGLLIVYGMKVGLTFSIKRVLNLAILLSSSSYILSGIVAICIESWWPLAIGFVSSICFVRFYYNTWSKNMAMASVPFLINTLLFIGYFMIWNNHRVWPEQFLFWAWLPFVAYICLDRFVDGFQNVTRNIARIYLIQDLGLDYDRRFIPKTQDILTPNFLGIIAFLWLVADIGAFALLLFYQGWGTALVARFGLMIIGMIIQPGYGIHLKIVQSELIYRMSRSWEAVNGRENTYLESKLIFQLGELVNQALREGRNPQHWWIMVRREAQQTR